MTCTAKRRAGALALGAALLLVAGASHAERGWVKDEVRVNIRTGPGTQYRIVGALKTGDGVDIVSRGDGWTEVRGTNGSSEKGGWIPAGFLQPKPPARVVVSQREEEAAQLRERLEKIEKSESELRITNEELSSRDGGQTEEITRLTRENMELKAGARWPEWITGASIVTIGMVLGAFLHAVTGSRRRSPRIKL